MLGGRALIVGAARDCAAGLRATLPRLERFKQTFDEVSYIIATNDSKDETENILEEWAKEQHRVEIIKLDHLADNVPQRTARLAIIRNICLSRLRGDTNLEFDYFVVVDLDGVNAKLIDEPSFSDAIASAPPDWGGVFANQRTKYYDIWALRHEDWCPIDCWQEVRKASGGFFRRKVRRERAVKRYVRLRQKHISQNAFPLSVDSAFGGLGVYKVSAIKGAFYVGMTIGWQEVCEHVAFNSMIRANCSSLYILPSLLNDAPEDHVQDL